QVVDQATRLLELAAQDCARGDGARVVRRQPLDEGAGDDGGRQRGAQLVGEDRDELVLPAAGGFRRDARRPLTRERVLQVLVGLASVALGARARHCCERIRTNGTLDDREGMRAADVEQHGGRNQPARSATSRCAACDSGATYTHASWRASPSLKYGTAVTSQSASVS